MNRYRLIVIALFAMFTASLFVSCQQRTSGLQAADTDSVSARADNQVKDSAYWAKEMHRYERHMNRLYAKGDLDSMELMAPRYKEVCLEQNNLYYYYSIWGTLAERYVWDDKFDNAVTEAQNIQEDAIQRHDSLGLFTSYRVLGTGYSYLNKFDEGESNLRKAISYFPYNADPSKLVLTYRILHIVLLTQHRTDDDVPVLKEWKAAIERAQPKFAKDTTRIGNWNFLYQCCLAGYLTETGDLKGASAALDSAEYYEVMEGSIPLNISDLYMRKVWLAWEMKDYQAALKYNDRELEIAKELNDNSKLKVALSDRVNTLDKLGRYRDALEEMTTLVDFKDSLSKVDMHDRLNELNKKFEVTELKMQAERDKMQAERRQLYMLIAIGAIVLIAVIFFILSRLQAARRMAEMKAAQERIESELRIARDIQMSMVPSQFPDYDGLDMFASMTPAKEVGGDLYGYVLIGDKLYFCVGDVSGKGVPASLFMAQATRLFRTLAAQQMMPAEICTRMNDALSGDDNESSMFVTLFLGLVDLQTGHLDFCNAGHNPPVLSSHFIEMVPNAPIGLFPGLEYEGESIDSIKDSLLFIYTDGLNEAENRQQQQFGEDRLLDILRNTQFDSARQVVDMLKKEVEQHRDGAAPNDDLTMMCIKVHSSHT